MLNVPLYTEINKVLIYFGFWDLDIELSCIVYPATPAPAKTSPCVVAYTKNTAIW